MDQVKLKGNRSEELENGVAESDLHHSEKNEAYEEDDKRKLQRQAAELIHVSRIHTGYLAPVRIMTEGVVGLQSE